MLCIKKCQIGIILIFLSIFSSIASGESLPDLAITAEDIHFSPENPTEGDSVTVTAYVVNKGSDTRDDIEVHFFESAPDKFGLPIEKGYIIIELKGGQRKKAKVKWRAKAGSNQIYVVIDPDNVIKESDKTNNQAQRKIICKPLEFPKPNKAEIETAVQKGVEWLRTQQGELVIYCPNGHENPSFMERCMICRESLEGRPVKKKDNPDTRGGWNPVIGPGATALVLMALLHAGVPETDIAVKDGIDYLLNHTPVPDWNEWTEAYDFAAAILALTATDNKEKYFNRVSFATNRILSMQRYGGWGYGAYPDMAHMQYVLLALYAVQKWGIDVPNEALEKSVNWVREMQLKDGGWSYGSPEVSSPWADGSYGSMTATALMILKICGIPTTDPQFEKGMEWLERNYTITSNPGAYDWGYYFLLTLQRAMTISPEQTLIREHNWYKEGAAYIISQQNDDGSWKGRAQEPGIMATPFAILFLTKAIP